MILEDVKTSMIERERGNLILDKAENVGIPGWYGEAF
jgi:hypothetical protein